QLRRYIFNAVVMKLVLGTFLAGAAIAGAHLFGYRPQTSLIVAIAGLGIVLNAIADVLASALQAMERMGKLALGFTVQQYASGVIGLVLLLAGKGIVVFCLVLAIGKAIPVIVFGYHLWPVVFARPRPADPVPPRGLGHQLWPEIFSPPPAPRP